MNDTTHVAGQPAQSAQANPGSEALDHPNQFALLKQRRFTLGRIKPTEKLLALLQSSLSIAKNYLS